MPKTKEQLQAEMKEKIGRFYELGDVSGLADYAEEIWSKYMPIADQAVGDEKNYPEKQTANEFIYEINQLIRSVPPEEGAKFAADLQEEFIRRKIGSTVAAAPVYIDFEEKIKNRDIPEAEYYVNDPEATRSIAATATKGSKAFNRVKINNDLIRELNRTISGMLDPGIKESYNKELSSRPNEAQISEQLWNESGLEPEIRGRIKNDLGDNNGLNSYGFTANNYYAEGSPIFQSVEGMGPAYLEWGEGVFEGKVNGIQDKLKNEAASKKNEDTYVDYFDATQKLAQILGLQKSLVIPTRTMSIQNDDIKGKINDSLLKPIEELSDAEAIAKMTPEQYAKLLEEAIGNIEKSIARNKEDVELEKKLADSNEILLSGYRAQKRSGTLDADEYDRLEKELKGKIDSSQQKAQEENLLVGAQEDILSNLKTWNEKLLAYNTESVKQLKDKPFADHIAAKRGERKKALESANEISETAELIHAKEDLEACRQAKNAGSRLKHTLEVDLESAADYNWLSSVNDLIESKLLANGSRVSKAKTEAVNGFVSKLAGMSAGDKNANKYVLLLGQELNERENKLKKDFDKRVKDIKSDILSGKVPGVFAASDKMAGAIASDIAYHTTNEGKHLKAVHDTKKQVFGALAGSDSWKRYIEKNKNAENDIAKLYSVPEKAGSAAEEFGYKVSDDAAKQISGTVFEKLPHGIDKVLSAGKAELSAMRTSCTGRLDDIELYEATVSDIKAHAKSVLDTLNATNKANHQNSGSYNNMVEDLKKIAELGGDGNKLNVSPDKLDELLGNLKQSSETYEREHTGTFIGKSKGFGRTRLNASKMLQNFADSTLEGLSKHKKMLDPERTVAEQREEYENKLVAIDDVALSKGYGVSVRRSGRSNESELGKAIETAKQNNKVYNGSSKYDNALAAAVKLKEAYESGDPAQILNAGTILKERVKDYLGHKRQQSFDGKKFNENSLSRIDIMNKLHLAGGRAMQYAKKEIAVDKDKALASSYEMNIQQEKQNVIDKTEREQDRINNDNRSAEVLNEELEAAGIDKKIDENARSYENRYDDKLLKGIDKVSANVAHTAFSSLQVSGNMEKIDQKENQEAREHIAELVLDKMIQLDYGKTMHQKLGKMNSEQFSQKAKELANSPAFNAAVPKNLNTAYIKNFLADEDGKGVMQVKNSIEAYRKAVKSVNANVNANQPERAAVCFFVLL
ncbi:MAG: hypothetical protein IJM75_07415 [Ruminococcus sp.]|nr:hypothetical protein [Ruminococcus sp.]